MAKTAVEFMAELASNKEYQTKKAKREVEREKLRDLYQQDQKALVKEINNCGFTFQSVWDFVNSKNDYFGAIPVLIEHLKIKHHPKILAGIAHSLAIKSLANNNELWLTLVKLYDTTLPKREISKAEDRGAQETIAVAIEQLANESRINDLKQIIEKNPNGDGIHWLKSSLDALSTTKKQVP